MSIQDILTADYFASSMSPRRASWAEDLEAEFSRPYMQCLRDFLRSEGEAGRRIYPECNEVFRVFDETCLTKVKVVIVGQDPYHNGTADGLAFSMRPGTKWLSNNNSLKQILAVVRRNGYRAPSSPCSLRPWANQGVLLLNPVMTVRRGYADSHKCRGWERFTDKVVKVVSDRQRFVVFLLWGDQAIQKESSIDSNRHRILEASHPMKSGGHYFQQIKHFSEANSYLREKGLCCIDWSLPCPPID